ncbi:hypothetical protein QAD02_010132 [Eretmocerus hayati]|uniref:Uncharacterized protein n=1 Tax=Eretmocerus hayati TaxID=131215 RepID=A0ACC2NB73_9HYME|nr:hypothetical protein QAD02_010132 [Eretmocerus hayati]
MKYLVALVLVTTAVVFAEQSLVGKDEWDAYKSEHGKVYRGEEDECRKKLYSHNKIKIDNHNKQYEAGLVSYSGGINQFTDELPGERNFGLLPRPGSKVSKSSDSHLSICEKIKKHIGEA